MIDIPITHDEPSQEYCYRVTIPKPREARAIVGARIPATGSEMAEIEAEIEAGPPLVATLRGAFGPPCTGCGGIADALCDFPIGDEGRTCDRSICSTCAPQVGADKNYCAEHSERGPGMLLFVPPPAAPIADTPARAPRLERKPPADRRWCVMDDDGRSGWMDQITATRAARASGGTLLTWDAFVRIWRAQYPLKKKPPRKK